MEGEIQDESGEDCDPLEEVAGATLESIRWPTATGECWRGWLYMSAKQFRRGLKQRSQIEAIRPNAWRNHPKKSARAYHVAPRVVERNPAAHLTLNMPAKPKLRALLVSHLKRFQKGSSRKLAPCSPPKKIRKPAAVERGSYLLASQEESRQEEGVLGSTAYKGIKKAEAF